MKVGEYTKTTVVIGYIDGLVDKTLIEEITNRLKGIEIDGILESGYIEEMIEDNPYSPFPQVLATERPDVACAHLLEGRAVILVEGTPFTLIAPISFFSLIQSHEDYYKPFYGWQCYPLATLCFSCNISFTSFPLCCCFDVSSGLSLNPTHAERGSF